MLPSEILVMQVQPVELFESTLHHLFIPELFVFDLGILHDERYSIVPRTEPRWSVYRDARGLFEAHHFCIALLCLHRCVNTGR